MQLFTLFTIVSLSIYTINTFIIVINLHEQSHSVDVHSSSVPASQSLSWCSFLVCVFKESQVVCFKVAGIVCIPFLEMNLICVDICGILDTSYLPSVLPLTNLQPEIGHLHVLLPGSSPCTYTGAKIQFHMWMEMVLLSVSLSFGCLAPFLLKVQRFGPGGNLNPQQKAQCFYQGRGSCVYHQGQTLFLHCQFLPLQFNSLLHCLSPPKLTYLTTACSYPPLLSLPVPPSLPTIPSSHTPSPHLHFKKTYW